MSDRRLQVVIALLAGAGARTAHAQPVVDDVPDVALPAPPTRASYQPDQVRSRSYLIPALESVAIEAGAVGASQIAGRPWADISLSSMEHNLQAGWSYDDDMFSVNQLGHPYGGATIFSTARSSGLGFWTSSAYAFTGSLMWEELMETNPPSLNDQLTTSFGGALLGEVLHRWGRSVRWGGGRDPGLGREVLASVIDPMGAANAGLFGERWRRAPPPRTHAMLAAGYDRAIQGLEAGPVHVELAVSHGLASDPRFVPRAPFHHFVLDGQLDVGETTSGYLALRGLLAGAARGDARRKALWGLYGTYDYWDAQAVRASAFAVGPGFAAHATIGDRGFVEASGLLAVVPWGAAGGTSDTVGRRDYQYGPGGHELVELRLGRTGLGYLHASARAIEVEGRLIGEANEAVVVTRGGAMLALGRHHALGADIVYSARHSRFDDAAMDAFDQAAQVRVMYAVTSDDDFTGPTR